MLNLIRELSESKVFPSTKTVEGFSTYEIAELMMLYLIGMRILWEEDDTQGFAKAYAHKTVEWGKYDQWRASATDLYVLLYAMKKRRTSDPKHGVYPLDIAKVHRWLKDMSHGRPNDMTVRRIFLRLDFDLRIKDSSMKSVRRLAMDWPDLTDHQKQLAMTRLLQMLRKRAPKSEILGVLSHLAKDDGLELKDVCNIETGEGCEDKPQAPVRQSFLSTLHRRHHE